MRGETWHESPHWVFVSLNPWENFFRIRGGQPCVYFQNPSCWRFGCAPSGCGWRYIAQTCEKTPRPPWPASWWAIRLGILPGMSTTPKAKAPSLISKWEALTQPLRERKHSYRRTSRSLRLDSVPKGHWPLRTSCCLSSKPETGLGAWSR